MAQLKLSNVIGAPFRPFVRDQLVTRVARSRTGGGLLPGGNRGDDLLRTSDEVLNLTNQLAWVKLSSSVKATDDYIKYIKDQFASVGDGDAYLDQWTAKDLARNWVLQGGTSRDINTGEFDQALFDQEILGNNAASNFQGRRTQTQLREGLGYDGAYGLGGIKAQGYRPMPGITSVKIQSAGRLGSLRYATINFSVWNRNQLDIIDTLYLRLGYTMLLEWGHTHYFENATDTLIRDNYGIDNFFLSDSKEDILYSVNRKVIDSNGNYDGMLGLVTNFDCSFNQEGGWDCSIKLIGLGSIMESQKINHAYTMPPGAQVAWDRIKKKFKDQREKELRDKERELNKAGLQNFNTSKQNAQQGYETEVAKRAKTPSDLVKKYQLQKEKLTALFVAARPQIASNFENRIVPQPGLEKGVKQISWIPLIGQIALNFATVVRAVKNLVNGEQDKFTNVTIDEPVDKILYTVSYYGFGGNLYLGHLKESGFQNPIKANSSTITVTAASLNTYTRRLVFSPPGAMVLLDDEYSAVDFVNLDPPRRNKGRNFFADLLYTSISYAFKEGGGQYFPTALLSSGFLGTNYFYFKFRTFLKSVGLGTGPNQPRIETADVDYQLFLRIKVRQLDGTDLPNQWKGLRNTPANIRAFLDGMHDALQQLSSYDMEVLDVTDGGRSTAIGAEGKTPFTINTPLEFLDENGIRLVIPGVQFILSMNTNILTVITKSVSTDFPSAPQFGTFTPIKLDRSQLEIDMANMSLGLGSALEAILTIIKYQTIVSAEGLRGNVIAVDNTNITGDFLNYGSGSLPPMAPLFKRDSQGTKYILNIDSSKPLQSVDAYPFLANLQGEELLKDPTSLGVKGYATALLQDYNRQPASNTTTSPSTPKQRWEQIPPVNFEGMMKSYLIKKHILSSAQETPNYKNEYPVYIKLSYLLFFINNQSLLYDTTRKSKVSAGINLARPIFYIDYNTETNLCGTTPSQLSIDPEVGMIPFKGNADDYKKLFIQNVTPEGQYFLQGKNIDVVSTAPAFNNSIKSGNYDFGKWFAGQVDNQAKTMDILLNIDYLLGVIKATVDRDNHNNVYLQAFLERIVADVNKTFGDVNAFRVAYNDAGNVVQILDDQYVPSLTTEDTSLFELKNSLLTESGKFIIPVFELSGLARNFTLQSDTSTKMSRAIAIGAQAANSGSVQSVDASSYHWLNNGLTDRFITVKDNATQPTTQAVTTNATNTGGNSKTNAKGKNNKATAKAVSVPNQSDPNKILATKFNSHVINIYSIGEKAKEIYRENVDSSRNFLMQSLTKAKAEDEKTYGSLTIPYNTSLTISGISGIMMGNAFLLPNSVLPLSIRGTESETRFGFYVMGLDHSLDNNQWITNIKGQIVRIREQKKGTRTATSAGASTTGTPTAIRNTKGITTTFIASSGGDAASARAIVETYFGKPMMDEEWDEMVALIFAEAGTTPEQKAYVAAAILNIANKHKEGITDSIRYPKRYEPVTGKDGKTSAKSFIQGPPPASEAQIYEAIIKLLPGVPKKINAFTAINPANYKGSKQGLQWRAKLLGYVSKGKGIILYNKNDKSNGTIFAEL